jgi:hypothetical protein
MEGSSLIMNNTEASYRREWATLTGKSESEIYVPEAIREPETVLPLAVGDRIRILEAWHNAARVEAGDELHVRSVDSRSPASFTTNAPRSMVGNVEWSFHQADEGIGWERVR